MRLRYYWVRRQSSQSRHFVIHPCFVSMAWQSFQHHDCPTHQILRLLPTIDFDLPHQQVQLLCLFWLDQSYQNHLRSHFSLFAQLCAQSFNHGELLASYLICCFLSATQLLKRNPLWSNLDLSERKVMKDWLSHSIRASDPLLLVYLGCWAEHLQQWWALHQNFQNHRHLSHLSFEWLLGRHHRPTLRILHPPLTTWSTFDHPCQQLLPFK